MDGWMGDWISRPEFWTRMRSECGVRHCEVASSALRPCHSINSRATAHTEPLPTANTCYTIAYYIPLCLVNIEAPQDKTCMNAMTSSICVL